MRTSGKTIRILVMSFERSNGPLIMSESEMQPILFHVTRVGGLHRTHAGWPGAGRATRISPPSAARAVCDEHRFGVYPTKHLWWTPMCASCLSLPRPPRACRSSTLLVSIHNRGCATRSSCLWQVGGSLLQARGSGSAAARPAAPPPSHAARRTAGIRMALPTTGRLVWSGTVERTPPSRNRPYKAGQCWAVPGTVLLPFQLYTGLCF